jgi:hypothetical protein
VDPSARLPLSQSCLSAMLSHSAQGWRDLDDSCEHDWLQAGPASRSENAASSTQAQGTPCPFHPLGKAQGGHGPHRLPPQAHQVLIIPASHLEDSQKGRDSCPEPSETSKFLRHPDWVPLATLYKQLQHLQILVHQQGPGTNRLHPDDCTYSSTGLSQNTVHPVLGSGPEKDSSA